MTDYIDENNTFEVEFQIDEEPTIEATFQMDVVNNDHNLLDNRDLPDQHPMSAITGLVEAVGTFTFEQTQASDTWTITHNLNKFPSVTIVDSAGNVFYPAVKYINENQVVASMNGTTTGVAYLN